MVNMRDYLREKKQRESNGVNYREKIRSHKLTVFYRIVLAVLLISAIIVFAVIQWRDKIYTQSVLASSAPISIVTGASVKNLDGNILLYSKDGASCIDPNGNAIWNRTYEMQSPLVSICGSCVAIGDYNGRTIYVMDKNSVKATINTNLPIRSLCVSENGAVAAALDDSNVIRLNVYDSNKDTENAYAYGKASMNDKGYPIDISLSPNGKLMAVSYLYVDGLNMKSSVAFYNFGEVGKNKTDNFASGYDYLNSVIPYMKFMDNGNAFAVADDRILFFQGAEIPTNVASNLFEEEVRSIYYNENYVGLVFNDKSGEATYRLDVYNKSGNKIHSQFIDMDYTDLFFHKDQIVIYNDRECTICNMQGVEKFRGSFDKSATLVIPSSSMYKYVMITPDSIDTIELK